MSQTQTSTKYAEPPIKINQALYGVLLASLASVFWGSMGVCVQYIFENTKTEPQALSSLRLLLSGIVLVILNLYLSRRPLLAAFSSLKGSLGIALSGIGASDVLYCYLLFKCGNRSDFHSNDAAACRNLPLFKRKETLYRKRGP